MAQIIDRPGTGQLLGQALGTGLGSGLQALAQNKMQQMQQGNLAALLGQTPGFNQQEAVLGALLPPQLQQEFFKQKMQAPQQQQFAQALAGLLGGESPVAQEIEGQREVGMIQSGTGQLGLPAGLTERQATQLAQLGLKKKAQEQQQRQFESKAQERRQERIEARLKPYMEEVQKKASGGKEDFERLTEMEEIIKKGDLTNPVVSSLLEAAAKGVFGFGVDLFGLTSTDTQKFRKLSKDFAKTAKNYFGSRVTEGEIKLLLDTFPSLSQSDTGKLAIIDRLKPLAAAGVAYDKALDEVLAEYDYQPPANLRTLVEKRVKPELDRLATEFKEKARERDVTRELTRKEQARQQPVKRALRTFLPGTPEFLKFGEI